MQLKTLAIVLMLPLITLAGFTVTSELTHEYDADAGRVINGSIKVQNKGTDPVKIMVYPKDYLFFSDGSNDYADPGTIERSNAPWIRISPSQSTIDGKSELRIDYVINVPDDITLDGSYWSMIMIEEAPNVDLDPKKGELALAMNMRYGVQVITNFGDERTPKIEFLNTELVENEEEKKILLDIENTGKITTRSVVKVEVYDMEGNFVGLFEGDNKRTYPGTSVRLQCDLSQLKKGIYKAIIMADCGEENIFGANVKLEM